MATTKVAEHARKIMLPTLVGKEIGQEVWGEPYIVYPWIAYMEQRIMEAIMDETRERYIIINAPPQTGKSTYVGTLLPFWITGMLPGKRVIYVSYSDDFSVDRGKDVRRLHQQFGEDLFGTHIDPDYSTAGNWRVSEGGGGMLSVGIGGLITGRPGHVIIIDDLIKNAEEAGSSATKGLHIKEWDGTIARRIQPGTTVIVMATRWADDDLSGVLQERMAQPGYDGPQWEVLEFPAFAEAPGDEDLSIEEQETFRDIIGREFGEVLDCRFSRIPGRDPGDFFRLARAGMDEFAWSCLYQQKPLAKEGGMFPRQHWRFYKPGEEPPMQAKVRVWDCAVTDGGGDWTVGTLMGRSGDKFYVLDVQRFRKSAGDAQLFVINQASIDGYGVKIKFEEEKGGSGRSFVASMERQLRGYHVEAAKAEGDKESRAHPYSAEQNKGNVYLPEKGTVPWDVELFISEHRRMMGDGRRPKHDDQIDTAAYCFRDLLGSEGVEMFIPGTAGISLQSAMNILAGSAMGSQGQVYGFTG